ncbi:hypothetical protein Bca4012_052928 [Brassica carinata]|uniref:Uncharacterized protein n=1 Tax=Brassica carinata TaxID=52824 RepID=A0A8X7RCL6_BRACI|nr:hypothetical protein Bca52824_055473 [Brassica carinata]
MLSSSMVAAILTKTASAASSPSCSPCLYLSSSSSPSSPSLLRIREIPIASHHTSLAPSWSRGTGRFTEETFVDGCERLSEESVELRGDSPGIPSLPISAADAEVILRSVVGGVGPGILNLSCVGKTVIAEIENVIGVIEGEQEPDSHQSLLVNLCANLVMMMMPSTPLAWWFGSAEFTLKEDLF